MKRRCLENGTWDSFTDKFHCVKLNEQDAWWNKKKISNEFNITVG